MSLVKMSSGMYDCEILVFVCLMVVNGGACFDSWTSMQGGVSLSLVALVLDCFTARLLRMSLECLVAPAVLLSSRAFTEQLSTNSFGPLASKLISYTRKGTQ